MKKYIILTTILSLFASKLYAGEFYVSPSILAANISVSVNQNDNGFFKTKLEKDNIDSKDVSAGLEAGYLFEPGNFVIGPELYYYFYDTSLSGFRNITNPQLNGQDNFYIKDSYGLALKFGYKFTDDFTLFTKLGLGTSNYNKTWFSGNSVSKQENQKELTSLFSIGASYDINDNFSIKLSHDSLTFNTSDIVGSIFGEDNFDVSIDQFNFGVIFRY